MAYDAFRLAAATVEAPREGGGGRGDSRQSARVASDQGLNKNRTVRGGKSPKVVGVARQQYAAARLGRNRNNVSVDDVFGSDARGVEHRSDEPSKGTVGVPASDGLLVPSEE